MVAYGDGASPPRNLSVFDGLQQVGSSSPGVTIPLSGFRTPSSGAVRSKVGVVAYEGDRGTTGDGLTLQGATSPVTLTNAVNPATNAFNSTISVDGADAGTRNPAYTNQLGFDADVFTATNVLGNGQTSTQVRLTTNGDAYQPGVVNKIATELFAPRIEATKAVEPGHGGARGGAHVHDDDPQHRPGRRETLVDFDDALPAGVTPLPNTLTVDGAPVPDPTGGPLRVADLPPGAQRVVAFRVRIDDGGIATGTVLENIASVAFTAADLGTRDTVLTPPARTRVLVPDVAITKRHSPEFVIGTPSTYTIEVRNAGGAPTVGEVRVADTLPAGLHARRREPRPGGPAPRTARTHPDAHRPARARSRLPGDRAHHTQQLGSGALSNTATVNTIADGDAGNNSYTDAGAATLAVVDLELAERRSAGLTADPNGFAPGERIEFELTVRNNGPDTARGGRASPIWRRPPLVGVDPYGDRCALPVHRSPYGWSPPTRGRRQIGDLDLPAPWPGRCCGRSARTRSAGRARSRSGSVRPADSPSPPQVHDGEGGSASSVYELLPASPSASR